MQIRAGEWGVKPMISVTQESVPMSQHCRGVSLGGEKGSRRGDKHRTGGSPCGQSAGVRIQS